MSNSLDKIDCPITFLMEKREEIFEQISSVFCQQISTNVDKTYGKCVEQVFYMYMYRKVLELIAKERVNIYPNIFAINMRQNYLSVKDRYDCLVF